MKLCLALMYLMVLFIAVITAACAAYGDLPGTSMGITALVGWGGWSVTSTMAYVSNRYEP